jgi:hypothetical protein
MNLAELTATYNEKILNLWAAHFALIGLGFNPADIYILLVDGPQLGVQLHTQGKEFTIAWKVTYCREEVAEQWNHFVTEQNTHTFDDALKEYWEQSLLRRDITYLVAALLAKGFVIPCTEPKN